MIDTIVFTRGVPLPEAFPTDELSACFEAALYGDPAVVLQYGQQPGYAPLRRELAREYGVLEGEVLIGNGSLQLQDLISAYLIGPGAGKLADLDRLQSKVCRLARRPRGGLRTSLSPKAPC